MPKGIIISENFSDDGTEQIVCVKLKGFGRFHVQIVTKKCRDTAKEDVIGMCSGTLHEQLSLSDDIVKKAELFATKERRGW